VESTLGSCGSRNIFFEIVGEIRLDSAADKRITLYITYSS
jgi:hypothetical protein